MLKPKNEKLKKSKVNVNFEAKQNLTGFFDLLLKIDMRNNPKKYKKPERGNDYDRHNNHTNPN